MLSLPTNTTSTTLAAAVAGGVILLLGLAAIRSESQLGIMEAREDAGRKLEAAALGMTNELSAVHEKLATIAADPPAGENLLRATAVALPEGPLGIWWSDGRVLEFASDPLVGIATSRVTASLDRNGRALIGPLTTANGSDVILLPAPVRTDGSRNEWLGVSLALDDLWELSGLLDLIQSGMDIAVVDDNGTTVYWTTPNGVDDPVSSHVDIAGSGWRLDVAPTAGWRNASSMWSTAVIVWILGSSYALWFFLLATRPQSLRDELQVLRQHLTDKDAELSNLLRSRSQLETQLVNSLTVDLHTGLPNRTSFVEHTQSQLAKSRLKSSGGILLATLQFAKLEELNNSMGASVAEAVMSQAADRVQRNLGSSSYLARTGEKELAICLPLSEVEDQSEFAGTLLESVQDRFTVGKRVVYLPACVGIATSPDGYEHGPELLTKASLAANAAVADGQRWSAFRLEAKEQRISLLQLEGDLQSAIDNRELRMHFQPIVSVNEGTVVGFESLLRWRHPTESWIGPDKFIPLAESMGQMHRITEWVLQQGIAHSRQWLPLREIPIYVTVNLTPRDLSRELCTHLFDSLAATHLPPECIRVEITETAVVRDFRIAARLISELNERGVRVLLDDFGTGYSSLSYLRDLPFHAVKIDKSFIHKMTTQARDFGLVRSIVSLVHYLGMECVAEGIETQEQLDLVSMMDCNYWQGYLFSRPVPASEVEALVNGQPQKPATAAVAVS